MGGQENHFLVPQKQILITDNEIINFAELKKVIAVKQCKYKQFLCGWYFSYSWYARTLVVPNLNEKKSYTFGFYCNSSFNEKNSFYNMVCKYHQNQNLGQKILPKRPQVATNRCFIKLDNSSAFIGVSEHHLLVWL